MPNSRIGKVPSFPLLLSLQPLFVPQLAPSACPLVLILSTFVVLFTLLGFFFFESGFFLSLKNSRFACSSSSSSSSGRARFPSCPTSSFPFPCQAPLLTSACNRVTLHLLQTRDLPLCYLHFHPRRNSNLVQE